MPLRFRQAFDSLEVIEDGREAVVHGVGADEHVPVSGATEVTTLFNAPRCRSGMHTHRMAAITQLSESIDG